ncbi:7978_t:CDS:2 [Racocetra fulgida]|uniref:7978_t:CDS:1 n=1 Tax=Racocetra fulgida TaxID=60492 RepID=A0A9N9GS83_9GLOM|nr:7978_t:CDS:2 [Racocetra fulgida]
MLKILSKITVGGQINNQIELGLDKLKLDNSIAEGYLDKLDSTKLNQDLFENQHFYSIIIGELNEGEHLKYRIDVEQLENVTVDVFAISEGTLSNDELPIVSLEHSNNGESSSDNDHNDSAEENDNIIETIDLSAAED